MFKKLLFSTVFFAFFNLLSAQNFYNPTDIKDIKLNFVGNNWDKFLDSVKQERSDSRLMGTMTLDGKTYGNVGVRYKGNSSYFGSRKKGIEKLPLNVKLDKKDKIE